MLFRVQINEINMLRHSPLSSSPSVRLSVGANPLCGDRGLLLNYSSDIVIEFHEMPLGGIEHLADQLKYKVFLFVHLF